MASATDNNNTTASRSDNDNAGDNNNTNNASDNDDDDDDARAVHFASRMLLSAIYLGDVERACGHIAGRANVNCCDVHGATALHKASGGGYPPVVFALLKAGADPNIKDHLFGSTPLHCADDPRIVAALVAAGADINARNRTGETPLHSTGRWGSNDAARMLIDLGADRELKNDDGETAAEYAVAWENRRTARVIASYQPGTSATVVDDDDDDDDDDGKEKKKEPTAAELAAAEEQRIAAAALRAEQLQRKYEDAQQARKQAEVHAAEVAAAAAAAAAAAPPAPPRGAAAIRRNNGDEQSEEERRLELQRRSQEVARTVRKDRVRAAVQAVEDAVAAERAAQRALTADADDAADDVEFAQYVVTNGEWPPAFTSQEHWPQLLRLLDNELIDAPVLISCNSDDFELMIRPLPLVLRRLTRRMRAQAKGYILKRTALSFYDER